jgi:selenide,water dikinase
MKRVPIFKDLVLVGGGHTHALVLRKWAMNPLPGVRITLISPQAMTPYSGMLPGLIAGHYSFEQTHIDLVKLSLWANIRFIQDSVTAIDVQSSTLALKNRPDIEFDAVSIDIGSTPNQQIEGTAEFTTAVKPISEFYQRWQLIQQQAQQGKIKSLAVVGGGAGSVEVIMAIAFKLKQFNQAIQYHLITAAEDVLPGYNRAVRNRVKQQLQEYNITIYSSTRVASVEQAMIHCQNGDAILADEIIWCTHASGSSWLQQSQLQS